MDSASQNLNDRMEGPAREPGAEAMGAAWLDLGPPIPARDLNLGTAPRPSQPHPGRTPPAEFFELGARAYTAYRDYEVSRMVAYRHLGLPAPMINVLPTVTPETRDRNYVVRIEAPECVECHQRHTVVAHRLYVMLYAQVPFLCLHGQVIIEIGIDEVTIGPPIFLPARIERLIPDGASQSSGGSVNVDKVLRDARAVSSAAVPIDG